jgi:hypothetical protein
MKKYLITMAVVVALLVVLFRTAESWPVSCGQESPKREYCFDVGNLKVCVIYTNDDDRREVKSLIRKLRRCLRERRR